MLLFYSPSLHTNTLFGVFFFFPSWAFKMHRMAFVCATGRGTGGNSACACVMEFAGFLHY